MTRATPRPAKGTAATLRRARANLHKRQQRAAKTAAKVRDGYVCRRCGAVRQEGGFLAYFVEAAHIEDAGMGGRPSVGCERKHFVTLCRDCHQGPRGVHAGFVCIIAGPDGGDGPVRFEDVAQPGVSNLPRGKTDTLTQEGG